MIIDLEKYRADAPYPAIKNVRQDRRLVATLMQAYSGESSETTTIMQYAYHSLLCKKNYNEISRVMRGIYYVETLHQEYLGDCIYKLGGELQYVFILQKKSLSWQSAVINYENTPAKMLYADIEGEKGAAAFYTNTAAMVNQPQVADLLYRLAEDENLHVKMLTALYHKYFR